jgi:hypothetical protein
VTRPGLLRPWVADAIAVALILAGFAVFAWTAWPLLAAALLLAGAGLSWAAMRARHEAAADQHREDPQQ